MIEKILFEEENYSKTTLDTIHPTIIEFSKSKGILKADNGVFKFVYVGMILHSDFLIYVLPKYFSTCHVLSPELINFYSEYYNNILLKAIKSKEFLIASAPFEVKTNTLFGIYLDLLEYYTNYGLYIPTKIKRSNNYDDKVNWNLTIEACLPVTINNSPVYIDIISNKSDFDNSHIITEIQKFTTIIAFENFGKFLGNYSISLESEHVFELYELAKLKTVINKQISSTFIDNDIFLLNLLLEFIDVSSYKHDEKIQLFGTTAFYYIWELACKNIFSFNHQLQSYFSPAIWRYNDVDYLGSGKPIPDILSIKGNILYILDAKYYLPNFSTGKVKHEPGTESISKQIIYQLLVRNNTSINVNTLKIYNAFLLPILDERTNQTLETIDDQYVKGIIYYNYIALPSINIIFLPVNKVFNTFLSNKRSIISIA